MCLGVQGVRAGRVYVWRDLGSALEVPIGACLVSHDGTLQSSCEVQVRADRGGHFWISIMLLAHHAICINLYISEAIVCIYLLRHVLLIFYWGSPGDTSLQAACQPKTWPSWSPEIPAPSAVRPQVAPLCCHCREMPSHGNSRCPLERRWRRAMS